MKKENPKDIVRDGYDKASRANPATTFMRWDGRNYVVQSPYSQKMKRRDDGGGEFRHHLDETSNGLIDAGFSIQRVHEEPYSHQTENKAPPGSWHHERAYVA